MQLSLIPILCLTVLLPYAVSLIVFGVVRKLNMSLAMLVGLVTIPLTFLLIVAAVLIPSWPGAAIDGFPLLFYVIVGFGIAAHIIVGLMIYAALVLYSSMSSTASI